MSVINKLVITYGFTPVGEGCCKKTVGDNTYSVGVDAYGRLHISVDVVNCGIGFGGSYSGPNVWRQAVVDMLRPALVRGV